jgi:hypothetical protein
METVNNLDYGSMSDAELDAELERLKKLKLDSAEEVPTDTQEQINQEQPSEGIRSMTQVYQDRIDEGRDPTRPGVIGYAQDSLEGTARSMYEGLAPVVGVADTFIDTLNFLEVGRGVQIPKLPKYENDTVQALRNISGLVIPSLGLRAKLLQYGAKAHAAGQAAPWLQRLGNSKSFQWFSKFGADVGTGAAVDYVAKQNQQDDNVFGILKDYFPKTYQWIPDSWATNVDDSPGEKRAKNVAEGAIFNVLAGVVEGACFLIKGGRSIKRASKFIGEGGKEVKVGDEFTDIKFSDTAIEDNVLRGYARKEKALRDINEYYLRTDRPAIDWNQFDEGETLVRTKDADGIIGAGADAAQIQNNIDSSWGRIGNLVHEATRMEGIELENLSNRTLVSELSDQIKKAGPVSKRLRNNKTISAKMIDAAGKKLAATILDPRVSTDEIIGILDEFKRSIDGSAIRLTGKKGINAAVKALKTQLADLDVQKARAYLLTSEAGQVADFSEGARLMEDNISVLRTVDAMADRLEVLTVEKGLANFEAGTMLSNMRNWKDAVETGDKEIINATADTILQGSNSKLTEIIPKAKEWTSTLKQVARENPQFLRPLLLANEFTDGDVDKLWKLHNWAGDNLSTFKKAIYDGNPNVPSIINKAMWSNLFNSALSAMSTPLNAGVGNLTGLLGKGAATVTGAVLQGDLAKAKKAMVAHFSLDDTLQKATDHLRLVFRKASTNPKEVNYIMRDDIALQEARGLDALRSWAFAASENGEDGGLMMLSVYDDLDALARDPVLRFGGNAMSALDGFSKSVLASTEAKYRAFNKLAQSGDEITEASFKKATDEIYETFVDANGMIKNDAVDFSTSEIALNANSPITEGMNEFIKRFPAARSFIWFPKTTANVIDTFGKWSPAGVLSADYQRMWGPLGIKKATDFSVDEIAEILKSKGKPIDEFMFDTFETLRYEVKGKAAIGSLAVTMAGMAMVNDRCTGTGHYNKAVQKQRIRSGWKPKSCKAPGTNKQISYEWMGPIGDWLSLTVDVIDNFDSLSSGIQEDLFNKLTFVLGSAVTNRSVLSQLEPMFDVLQGNGAAASRWATSFGNNFAPLGSLRNEIGKIMYPQLRQIRSELKDHLRNRNAWLDSFDPERALPSVVDPIDGQEIGKEDNWFLRVWNRGPLKITSRPSKERQFLIDIEFNNSPNMRVSQRGVVLENHEITAINSKMGEMGLYKEDINEIMKDAARLTYTGPDGTVYRGFKNIIQAQRRGMISSEILDSGKYQQIFTRLKRSYENCKRLAENNLPEPILSGIRNREYEKLNSEYNQEAGDLDQLYEDSGLTKTLNIAK